VHSAFRDNLTVEVASFSRNQISCSSIGPRGPAVMTLLLSTTGAPAAVVNPFLLIFIS